MNAEIQAILSRYDLPNNILLGDLSGHLTGDELERVHYLLKYPNEKTEPKGGRMTMSNIMTVEIKLLVEVDTENSELCPTGDAVTSNCVLNTIESDFFLEPVKVLEVREASDE